MCSYDDGDSEEVAWEDVFAGQRARIRGIRLPEAAIKIGQKFSQPSGARQALFKNVMVWRWFPWVIKVMWGCVTQAERQP